MNRSTCTSAVFTAILLGLILLSNPLSAEFLTPLAGNRVYGCSVTNKVHKTLRGGKTKELRRAAIRKLIADNQPTGIEAEDRKRERFLRALRKCQQGTLKLLDPCAALDSGQAVDQIRARVANGKTCTWQNSFIVKVIKTVDEVAIGCTGIAVSKHVVLTAQHCVLDRDGFPADKIEVYLEDLSVFEPDDIIGDPDYVEFPDRPDSAQYDIAALAFAAALPIPRTAKIASSDTIYKKKERALVAGFGRDENYVSEEFRLKAGFLRVKEENISSIVAQYKGLPGQSGPCKGDSGGPLLVERAGEFLLAGTAHRLSTLPAATACTAPYDIYYTKLHDCQVLDLFEDFLCSEPYHNAADGECLFKACEE